jgi:hypothetical protein
MKTKNSYKDMSLYLKSQLVRATPCSKGKFLSITGKTHINTNIDLEENGYHVIYSDGYESWCPKKSFEKTSRIIKSNDKELIFNW